MRTVMRAEPELKMAMTVPFSSFLAERTQPSISTRSPLNAPFKRPPTDAPFAAGRDSWPRIRVLRIDDNRCKRTPLQVSIDVEDVSDTNIRTLARGNANAACSILEKKVRFL